MTTVAALRGTYLNPILRRVDGDNTPWTDGQADQAITDALRTLFVDGIGKRTNATVATSQASDVYAIPAALQGGRISRIELEQSSGGTTSRIQKVTSWQVYSDTQVRIRPLFPTDASLALRFFGWAAYAVTGSDLPTRLEPVVAWKAAALAYGQELGQLANSQLQQGLDQGRVVDYPTAAGMSAYWERRYRDAIEDDPDLISLAPRHAHR